MLLVWIHLTELQIHFFLHCYRSHFSLEKFSFQTWRTNLYATLWLKFYFESKSILPFNIWKKCHKTLEKNERFMKHHFKVFASPFFSFLSFFFTVFEEYLLKFLINSPLFIMKTNKFSLKTKIIISVLTVCYKY